MKDLKFQLPHNHARWFKNGEVIWVNLDGKRLFHAVVAGTAAVVERGPALTASLKEGLANKNLRRVTKSNFNMVAFSKMQSLDDFIIKGTGIKKILPKHLAEKRTVRNIPVEVIETVVAHHYDKARAKKKADYRGYPHCFYNHLRFEHFGGISSRAITVVMQDLTTAYHQHHNLVKYDTMKICDITVRLEDTDNIFDLTSQNILAHLAGNDRELYREIKDILQWFAWMGRALAQYMSEVKIRPHILK